MTDLTLPLCPAQCPAPSNNISLQTPRNTDSGMWAQSSLLSLVRSELASDDLTLDSMNGICGYCVPVVAFCSLWADPVTILASHVVLFRRQDGKPIFLHAAGESSSKYRSSSPMSRPWSTIMAARGGERQGRRVAHGPAHPARVPLRRPRVRKELGSTGRYIVLEWVLRYLRYIWSTERYLLEYLVSTPAHHRQPMSCPCPTPQSSDGQQCRRGWPTHNL